MKYLLKYLKPFIWQILIIFVLVAFRAYTELLLPQYLGVMISDGVGVREGSIGPDLDILFNTAITMIIICVASIVTTIISTYFETNVASKFAAKLRNDLYVKVQSFSLEEANKFQTSSLITRCTNDIMQLQNFISQSLRSVILQPFMAIGAIILSVTLSPSLSLIVFVGVLSVAAVLILLFIYAVPKFDKIQKLMDRLNLVTRENLTGVRVVRAYNNEEEQISKIEVAAKDSKNLLINLNKMMAVTWPSMNLIMGISSALVIYFGIDKVMGLSSFEAADLIIMQQYTQRVFMSFMFIAMMFVMFPRAAISARRVFDVINSKSLINDPETPEYPLNHEGIIEFQDVSFSYDNSSSKVLSNISFVVPKNKVTAIIGSTGSGKSTLIHLIPRFFEVSSGSILIDGVNVKDYKLEDLYNLIGYVPQKGILFSGTLADNVLFSQDNFDKELLESALDISLSKEFVDNFKEKEEYQIARGGVNVSGGQRQRLSIARAIAKKPIIYLFDDSFSALDYQTDKILRNNLKTTVNATILIVAQRINTIRNADQIIVLDKGELVGSGTHEYLLKNCEVYREIAESQLKAEELL
ncbi:MAG: ABC transporter ATP-binding protein/permease [Acholeplasmatales bacterium]|jgi:ATP-binding cassette subfamily B protein|nr:ABC transporter ATP-binding protein/permease [Acholeplasmatales bacterium]